MATHDCLTDVNPVHDFSNILTDIDPENKPALMEILKKYSKFFTENLPYTRVKSGEMQIRLLDPS
ncbi:unnamed protein product, partial [Nesidiocoris tenuis]